VSYLLPKGMFSRRDFLKVAGAAGAGLVVAPSLLAAAKKGADAPVAGGAPFYHFVNATKGAFTDDQIGWAWSDRGPFTPLSQSATAPNGNGKGNGRMYFQLKNSKGEWKDFIEWAGGGTRWAGNTTQVDEFIIPMTIEMGTHKIGISEPRAKMFEAFLKECPKEFKNCVRGDKAIVSPFKADLGTGKPFEKYFEKYVAEVMPGSPISTKNILLGEGPLGNNAGLCAAFNRHVVENKADWKNPAKFYLKEPCNWYSKFLHEHTVDHHCYGFCYDDASEQAAYFGANGDKLTVTIYWD